MTESALASNISNVPEYSVSDIAGAVKRLVEDHFGRVRIRGEISGFKLHSSGHAYFALKDTNAVLDAVCWRGTVGKLNFKAEDGLEIIAIGRLTTYPGRSKYQLVVEHMEPAGAGALMALLEQRKVKFAAEGLFDPARKKALPFLPRVVGVVTSPTGAVIRDILHRISDRFPLHVIVWPVAVQGEGAAEQIATAIRGFEQCTPRPDVLIVARGGGSVEDLWAFNEEIVVRAASACTIPLISAVGHETDTTLIDFVADKRAPTPTAAAEMATPVREELRLGIEQLAVRQRAGMLRFIHQRVERIEGLKRGLPRPASLLDHAVQRLDDWSERLHAAPPVFLALKSQTLQRLSSAFRPQLLLKETDQLSRRLEELHSRAQRQITRLISEKERGLGSVMQLFASLNYTNVLKRGFALVKTPHGGVVSTAAAAAEQPALTLVFQDGEINVQRPFGSDPMNT